MIILGIETSCDETAISVVEAKGDLDLLDFKVLGSAVQSQIEVHKPYGGVFPTLAKREHQKNLPVVLTEALKNAGFLNSKFEAPNIKQIQNPNNQNQKLEKEKPKIDLIAVTVGPGLEPALWTGIKFAEELGKKWGIPVIPANHMEGHIASVLINKTDEIPNDKSPARIALRSMAGRQIPNQKIKFPAIALLISGGHTELVLLKSWKNKEKIGETKDDAVGEAFDKVARMLGLPYPGGPEISKLAEEARSKNISLETKFPRPMIHSKNFDFSFSGLKTAVLYYLKKENGFSDLEKIKVAREFEDAVIETLLFKTRKAIEAYLPKTFIIGGGVVANKALRENFLKLKNDYPEMEVLIPEKSLTTDNATMIAATGFIEYLINGTSDGVLKARGNLDI